MTNGKHTILYVDDDKDMLDAMKVVLESHGYAMEMARTAEEGLRVYKQANPDLVIVDLMMEEIDAGTNLLTELKAVGYKAPVYMLSSMGDNLTMATDTRSRPVGRVPEADGLQPADQDHRDEAKKPK